MANEETENLTLEHEGDIDLKNEIDNEDDIEFGPPDEENKAKSLNTNNIFIMIGVFFLLIIIIVFSVNKISKHKKEQKDELSKSGVKFVPEIEIKDKNTTEIFVDENLRSEINDKEDLDVDQIIKGLPDDFKQPEPGTAPIYSNNTSTSSSYSSSRPDTRNSNSIRKIEGLYGQEYTASNNQSILTGVLSGNSYASNTTSQISREDYISNLLKASTQYSNQMSGQTQPYANQSNKESFYNQQSNIAGQGQYLSYASLWDGTIISGALETAVNTDNPGLVIARVTENVYSSYDHSFLLVPEGTLLYATYNSSVSYGQNRVQIAWNLMIRPDGYRIELGNMNGVDAQGQSGTKGHVTNHPFETLKALGLVAIFSVIQTEVRNDINTQNNEYLKNSMASVYSEANKLGSKIIDRALDIKPTITIPQGTKIKLITNATLELPPVKVNQVTRKYVRTN